MTRSPVLTVLFVLTAAAAWAQPADRPAPRRPAPPPEARAEAPGEAAGTKESLAADCGAKIQRTFPPVRIAVSELALDHVKLGQQLRMVSIPLKTPRGEIRAIHWFENDPQQAFELIKLLQSGRIAAVAVLPFVHDPSEAYIFRGASPDDLRVCQTDKIIEVLGRCTECEVLEWLDIKP